MLAEKGIDVGGIGSRLEHDERCVHVARGAGRPGGGDAGEDRRAEREANAVCPIGSRHDLASSRTIVDFRKFFDVSCHDWSLLFEPAAPGGERPKPVEGG